jgi:hypothetical protein
MPFTISPGVVTKEIDLTTVVPEVSMTEGAFAGPFRWGPAYWPTTVSNEAELAGLFGKPDANTYESFFSAANYLSYSGNLKVVRTPNSDSAKNASAAGAGIYVANDEAYENTYDGDMGGTPVTTYGSFIAKWPGELGNSLRVSMCAASKANTNSDGTLNSNTDTTLTGTAAWTQSSGALAGVSSSTLFLTELSIGDVITLGSQKLIVEAIASASAATARSAHGSDLSAGAMVRHKNSGFATPSTQVLGTVAATANGVTLTGTSTFFDLQVNVGDTIKLVGINEERKVSSITSNTVLTVSEPWVAAAAANTWSRTWEYVSSFDSEPTTTGHAARNSGSQDEIHVVVIDEDGDISGANNTVIESFPGCSVAKGAKSEDGQSIYYKDVINRRSQYIRHMDHEADGDADSNLGTTAWGGAASGTFNGKGIVVSHSLANGNDGGLATDASKMLGLDEFKNSEKVDVTLLATGEASAAVAIHAINSIAEYRKDCVAFISPEYSDVVNNAGSETTAVVDFRNTMPSSSYAVMDSGWKYQYDKYNDVYRYIPLNGDVAGTCAYTDNVRDPFFSPAGIERGGIRNSIKLPYNPNKTDRDNLYKNGVNPVTAMPGTGIILFGDKTLLAKPSAFDRINVRRLFILLEKSVANMAKGFLFEFNDAFTRSRFSASVESFMRDIQGRGGVQDFAVVCDDSNNTPEVVDRNEFRGDIYVKPSRSINFIQLQFVAVRSGVEFSEIIGGGGA